MRAAEAFRQAIEQAGLTVPEAIVADGKLHRFASNGDRDDDAGWYLFFPDGVPAGAFGCWRSGLKQTWCGKSDRQMCDQERADYRRRLEAARQQREAEEQRRHAEAATRAQMIWDAAHPAGDAHPYLVAKQVRAHGLRVDADGRLVVPVFIKKTLASLQFIPPAGQEKRFLFGGEKKGGSFVLGELTNVSTMLIAEGFATAASLYEATSLPTVIAFDASNLQPVAEQIRQQYPEAQILVCGDHDKNQVGQTAAREAAEAVGGVVVIPDLEGLDWNDVRVQQGLDAVRQKIASVQNKQANESRPTPDLNCTDAGNAIRFASQHRNAIRWCPPWKSWLFYDGMRWRRDDNTHVMKLAKQTARSILEEARQTNDDDRRRKLAAWAISTESVKHLAAMIELAKSEDGITVDPGALDTDLWLLNVKNGTLDLRTGTLLPHDRNQLITKLTPIIYNPDAMCPTWATFLMRIMNNEKELIDFLQVAFGYSLTGSVREQMFFLLHGKGRNGKSTLVRVLLALLGDYSLQTDSETLLLSRQEGRVRNDLARFAGARVVGAIESDTGRKLAPALIKQLTGGDIVTARFLFSEFFEIVPTWKIWFSTNHRPIINDDGDALWRRPKLIPFSVQIPESEQDQELLAKLTQEMPGIVVWAVQGCLRWQRDGLKCPAVVQVATASYREAESTFEHFLQERCICGPREVVPFSELRQAYTDWAEGTSDKPISSKAFSAALQEHGFQPVLIKNARHYAGLRVRTLTDDLAMSQATETEDVLDVG